MKLTPLTSLEVVQFWEDAQVASKTRKHQKPVMKEVDLEAYQCLVQTCADRVEQIPGVDLVRVELVNWAILVGIKDTERFFVFQEFKVRLEESLSEKPIHYPSPLPDELEEKAIKVYRELKKITAKEAREMLGLPQKTVDRWLSDGVFEGVHQYQKKWHIPLWSVEEVKRKLKNADAIGDTCNKYLKIRVKCD